ncbi:DNA polymerase delta small subunit OS=Arabidopsis thaliana GN=POLD2 PE=2 SV=2 [Rhizoctonia solani AG-1 IB]|uniref:DNA-directed DNA polymerase n=1 Tax=Thanatephorus cucumeris (strain AG1-IB / isolate 7/3/14) TaxID=1108050 RepID=A0A0B7FBK6_THACB|nr:DNA polymerase delta small subunit OS=Arabidopsis thaliana GN=POLD2 PE=2 SV=2 [Rhizoctonia solani AG-1 IB]
MSQEYRSHATIDDSEKLFKLLAGQRHYGQQFDTVYAARLCQLRPALLEKARQTWGKCEAPHVPRVLDVVKGQQCYIIGTVYMDMPLKANVLEDIAQDHALAMIPVQSKRTSNKDSVMLEDESGRVGLIGDLLAKERLVTGINIAVLGSESDNGEFEVDDIIYPGLAPPAHIPNATPNESSYCAFLSGLLYGETASTDPIPTQPETNPCPRSDVTTTISLFLEWVSGEGGSEKDRDLARRVNRVVIAGDSLAAPNIDDEREPSKVSSLANTSLRQAVSSLGETFQEIARTVPLHVLPGASDPAGAALPQQPLPSWIFQPQGQTSEMSDALRMESNPTWIHSNGKSILIHSGQPLDDIYMHSVEDDRMSMVRNTLKWRHIAPTAPDTLWSYPFDGKDPFVLDKTPDIYVVGNQPEFGTEMVGPTRVVLLPRFASRSLVYLCGYALLDVTLRARDLSTMQRPKTTSSGSPMAPGTPTPRAHVRTAPGRISRPSTAPTPTSDSAPMLPTSSPQTSRQPSPAPPPAATLEPERAAQTPQLGGGSAPPTSGILLGAGSGVVDWPTFMQAYANGEWDPVRIPEPPFELKLPETSMRTSSSPVINSSALSSSSTVAATLSPSLSSSPGSVSPSRGLVGSDRRPRIVPDSRTSSIASRRGTATPDLSGSTANFIHPNFPYINAPRKVQRSHSDVEVRSPGGVPPTTLPALPSPSIDRATVAATIRWAGSGVNVAPYALPSPEAAELLDPMRKALPVLNSSSSHPKSRLSNFWEESPKDPLPPPAIVPQPPSPEAVSSKESYPVRPYQLHKSSSWTTRRPSNSHGDYFSRSPSQIRSRTHSRSPTSDKSRDVPSQPSSGTSQTTNPPGSLPTTTWTHRATSSSQTSLADACLSDPFQKSVISSIGSSLKPDSGVYLGNGYSTMPDQLLTSLSSSADVEFFTPSETLVKSDEDEQPSYLIPPLPPDELERRKALYRFNILHTSRDANFDRITHLCKLVFSTKMAIISLIDKDYQWFKSESGFGADGTSRDSSFCAHSIFSCHQRGAEPLVVTDATQDWRFANNPFVAGPPHIRFYAGAPLRTTEGYNIGTLCILDDKTRDEFTPRQRHTLKEFAAIVMREMELWRDKIQLQVRDRIQTSMERFTRECLELEESGSPNGTSMEKVYDRASKLVKRALDLEGATVLDIANFECVESFNEDGTRSYSYRGDTFADSSHGSAPLSTSPGIHPLSDKAPGAANRPFERISPPVVLGASHTNFKAKHTPTLSGADHERLSSFLANYPDGKIYEHITPSYLRDWAIPSNATYSMIVPIFNVDHHPFALLCAYITDPSKHLLEGYELQFLRAIGVIILSAMLKRRMILADKAKSLFISNISHELRTPLHGILAAAELIADTKLTDTQSAFLKTIQSCGASLGETVNHVLDFTKLSGNREHTIPRSKTNLLTLVEDTVEGCWIGARARAVSEIGSVYSPPRALPGTNAASQTSGGRHVETIVDVAYRERGWSCVCEKAGIRRILMNLIGNSLKFTSDGYVYIGLREVAYNEEDRIITVELSVNDTGKGISKDFLTNQLFQPFSQENPLHTGTGLGLAIVNSIVRSEAVNGQVDVWSQEGVGTEIKISFDVEELPSGPGDASLVHGRIDHLSVCMHGFSSHRGEQELQSTVSTVLTVWWNISFVDHYQSDVLLVNEDIQFLSDLVNKQEFSKPVVLLTSSRGDQRIMGVVKSFERLGGFCRLIFKPGGPSRLFAALKDCKKFRDGELLSGVHALPNSPGTPPTSEPGTRRSSQNVPYSPRQSRDSLHIMRGLDSTDPTPLYEPELSRSTDDGPPLSRSLSDFQTIPLADEGSVMLESATGTLGSVKKPRVLVVEDNPINRNILAVWLKKKGLEFKEATDGIEGVGKFRNAAPGHYQILLVDLSMPNLGGIGCVTQIRAIERERRATVPAAKIFALTGLATPEDKRQALAAGFDGYLIKPVSLKTLDGLFKKLASG